MAWETDWRKIDLVSPLKMVGGILFCIIRQAISHHSNADKTISVVISLLLGKPT